MYFSFGPEISYQILNASGVINDSGKPQALYQLAVKSGGTAGVVTVFDGSSGSGTAVYDFAGTISATAFHTPAMGEVFPKGLFVSFDTNVTKVTAWCRQVQNI